MFNDILLPHLFTSLLQRSYLLWMLFDWFLTHPVLKKKRPREPDDKMSLQ